MSCLSVCKERQEKARTDRRKFFFFFNLPPPSSPPSWRRRPRPPSASVPPRRPRNHGAPATEHSKQATKRGGFRHQNPQQPTARCRTQGSARLCEGRGGLRCCRVQQCVDGEVACWQSHCSRQRPLCLDRKIFPILTPAHTPTQPEARQSLALLTKKEPRKGNKKQCLKTKRRRRCTTCTRVIVVLYFSPPPRSRPSRPGRPCPCTGSAVPPKDKKHQRREGGH